MSVAAARLRENAARSRIMYALRICATNNCVCNAPSFRRTASKASEFFQAEAGSCVAQHYPKKSSQPFAQSDFVGAISARARGVPAPDRTARQCRFRDRHTRDRPQEASDRRRYPGAARAIQRLSLNWSCRPHRVSSPWRLSCPLRDKLCKTTGPVRRLPRRFQLFACRRCQGARAAAGLIRRGLCHAGHFIGAGQVLVCLDDIL